jgi:hypothetical protein
MGTLITDGLDSGDDQKVISILNKWKGGPLSDQLFTSLSKLTPQISAIITVFRKRDNIVETLLLPRPSDDPLWPNMLNLPGKMFRAMDFKRDDKNPVNGPLERIQKGELKVELNKLDIKFAGLAFQDTIRGPIMVLVHTVFVAEDFNGNLDWVWREVSQLKDSKDMIPTEMDAIEVALKSI